jgi:hypothetical protein
LTGPIPSELGSLTGLEMFRLRKFATISSSEFDTITLLGSLSHNLSHLYGYIDDNQLTGNLDTIFCNNDAFSELSLDADCAGSPPEVVCTCCDGCF